MSTYSFAKDPGSAKRPGHKLWWLVMTRVHKLMHSNILPILVFYMCLLNATFIMRDSKRPFLWRKSANCPSLPLRYTRLWVIRGDRDRLDIATVQVRLAG